MRFSIKVIVGLFGLCCFATYSQAKPVKKKTVNFNIGILSESALTNYTNCLNDTTEKFYTNMLPFTYWNQLGEGTGDLWAGFSNVDNQENLDNSSESINLIAENALAEQNFSLQFNEDETKRVCAAIELIKLKTQEFPRVKSKDPACVLTLKKYLKSLTGVSDKDTLTKLQAEDEAFNELQKAMSAELDRKNITIATNTQKNTMLSKEKAVITKEKECIAELNKKTYSITEPVRTLKCSQEWNTELSLAVARCPSPEQYSSENMPSSCKSAAIEAKINAYNTAKLEDEAAFENYMSALLAASPNFGEKTKPAARCYELVRGTVRVVTSLPE